MPDLVTIRSGDWPLSGVVHTPPVVPERRVGVVLLHENLNTKFGTHRIFYQLGEALAESGLYALRHDNRGTCDSPGVHALTFLDRVEDACAASKFLAREYRLDAVLFWGLCMGAAVAVHASQQLGPQIPAGMMLCSLLADPLQATLPQFGYDQVNLSRFIGNSVTRGSPWRKAAKLITDQAYWQMISKRVTRMVKRYFFSGPELGHLQKQIARVGNLLSGYSGPMVFVFGDKDDCFSYFVNRLNANDRLGLATPGAERTLLVIEGGDHTFSVLRHTDMLIGWTVAWAEAMRDGSPAQFNRCTPELIHGFPVASPAN